MGLIIEESLDYWKQSRIIQKVEFVFVTLLFVFSVCIGIVKSETINQMSNKFKTGVFFYWFSFIFVSGVSLFKFITHTMPIIKETYAKSRNLESNYFQIDIGVANLAIFISMILSNTLFDYTSQLTISVLWSIMSIFSGIKRSYDFTHGDHSFSNISSIWWDFIPSLILLSTGIIGQNNV